MFTKTILKNGLRLITIPMDTSLTVTCLVVVNAGSSCETKRTNGVAHFLEHMMFKGTEKRPSALEISTLLDGIGSSHNAFTDKELTGYYVKVAAEHLTLALDVLADNYQNSLFLKEEIEKERGVILEEISMDRDNPARYLGDLWERLLYGDTPEGRPVSGEKENIVSLQRGDLTTYLGAHYIAQNTVVVISGKFNPDTIGKTVSAFFGRLPSVAAQKKRAARIGQRVPQFSLTRNHISQAHLAIGVRAYGAASPKRYALSLLSTILGGGMSSRLFCEVREKRGLAYSVHCGVTLYTSSGYLATEVGTRKEAAEEVLGLVVREYKKIAEDGVGAAELEKAKHYLEGKLFLGLETSDELAFFAGEQELLYGRIMTPRKIVKNVRRVTAPDIRDVAREIFRNDRLNAALLGPFKEKEGGRFKKLLSF